MVRDTWTRAASAMAFAVVIALAGSAMAAAKQSFAPLGLKHSPTLGGHPVAFPSGPPSFPLMGQDDSPQAKGTALIHGNRLSLIAKGLKPNAVYTVWFVNMQPTMAKEGAGSPPFAFRTNQQGRGKYVTPLNESPIGQWEAIFIIRHPSGDPEDMDHIEDALMAKLM